jgi:hypothetical protein
VGGWTGLFPLYFSTPFQMFNVLAMSSVVGVFWTYKTTAFLKEYDKIKVSNYSSLAVFFLMIIFLWFLYSDNTTIRYGATPRDDFFENFFAYVSFVVFYSGTCQYLLKKK